MSAAPFTTSPLTAVSVLSLVLSRFDEVMAAAFLRADIEWSGAVVVTLNTTSGEAEDLEDRCGAVAAWLGLDTPSAGTWDAAPGEWDWCPAGRRVHSRDWRGGNIEHPIRVHLRWEEDLPAALPEDASPVGGGR